MTDQDTRTLQVRIPAAMDDAAAAFVGLVAREFAERLYAAQQQLLAEPAPAGTFTIGLKDG